MRVYEVQYVRTTYLQRVETPSEAISDETKDCTDVVSQNDLHEKPTVHEA